MSQTSSALVNKLWNYCNILSDDGLSYGYYVEQLTFLLFLGWRTSARGRPTTNLPSSRARQGRGDCLCPPNSSRSRDRGGFAGGIRSIRTDRGRLGKERISDDGEAVSIDRKLSISGYGIRREVALGRVSKPAIFAGQFSWQSRGQWSSRNSSRCEQME